MSDLRALPRVRFAAAGVLGTVLTLLVMTAAGGVGGHMAVGSPGEGEFAQLAPGSGPTVHSVSATPPATDVNHSVALRANVSGTGTLAYNWSGLPPGCSTADTTLLHCTPNGSGNFVILFTATNVGSRLNGTGVVNLSVSPGPTVVNFSANPATVRVGATTTFSWIFEGGTPPFLVSFLGLPPGCAYASQTPFTCTPTRAGTYTPVVIAQDAVGASTNATTPLTVSNATGTAPQITDFFASPNNVTLGSPTTFYVLTTGGALPLSYNYSGLPPGCATANAAVVNCTPAVAGAFTPTVTVHGADGLASSAATLLLVMAPPPAPLALIGFVVYPAVVGPGNFTLFAALTTGGVSPLTYVYTGLPPGCLSLPLPILPCRTSTPGTYTVTLRVTDSAGAGAGSTVTLTVQSPPGTEAAPSVSSGPTTVEVAEYVGVGIVAGVAATAAVFVLGRRRRSRFRP